jgi:hypothetical protein
MTFNAVTPILHGIRALVASLKQEREIDYRINLSRRGS